MNWWQNFFAPMGYAPDVTVPIPQHTMALPNPNFYASGRDQFNSIGGVNQALYGSPFMPTMFDGPNTFRPGSVPGEMTVAPKPMSPLAGRNPAPAASPPDPSPYQESAPPTFLPGTYEGMRVDDPNFKQPVAPEAPKPPNFYERNKDWITMLSRDLGALGKGMISAPPGTNPYGVGFANVTDDRERREDRDLKRQLLKAQVGEAESKAGIRKSAQEIAKSLPKGHPAVAHLVFGNYADAAKHLGMDPEKLMWVNDKGEFVPNMALAQMKAYIQASQGAMKWSVIGKSPSGNDIYGYPPMPQPPGAAPTYPTPSQGATAQPGAVPPQGVGDRAPLAPGETGYTKGQEKQDQEFAKDAVEWKQTGRADMVKNIEQLRAVHKRLAAGERLTGPEIGNLPGRVREVTNPSAIQAYEQVQEVVQRNLRAVLGGQFAQLEGRQLIDRAYNLRLPPEQNAERVSRLLSAIEQAAKAKEEMAAYFDKYGTLSGYKGPTMGDLQKMVRDSVADTGQRTAPSTPQAGRVDTGKKLNNKPVYWNPSTRKYETD